MLTAESAYARAGVNQTVADDSVDSIVSVLRTIDLGRDSRQALSSGHFANIIRITDELGIALSTDGVGTKLLIAEELGRFDTVGIDCIAMNVNDVICVGAEPLAMLDYLAVDSANPEREGQIALGLKRGAEEAGIEIPGGELAQLGDIVHGFDIAGACFGLIDLNAIIAGGAIAPGDVVIGLPSSGLHANGYTLARRALEGIPLDTDPDGRLGRQLGDVLLEPTKIYVKPVMELIRSGIDVRGLAHITSQGFDNLLRLQAKGDIGYRIDDPISPPPVFGLIQERGKVSDEEMHEVFNMGCGFCCIVAADEEDAALELLRGHYRGAKRIGQAVAGDRVIHRETFGASSA
jgi:phosphoribosylformylglycinamidine cyclo-ligase